MKATLMVTSLLPSQPRTRFSVLLKNWLTRQVILRNCSDGSFFSFDFFFLNKKPLLVFFLSGVSTVSNCAAQYKKSTQRSLKRFFEQRLVVSRLLVSWERSNGVGEGKKEFIFHSCVHATSSKTSKLLQLAWYQLCFLLKRT